jgi:hypothetical protein
VEELLRCALDDLYVAFVEKPDGGEAGAGRLAAFVAMTVRCQYQVAVNFIADRPAQTSARMYRHYLVLPVLRFRKNEHDHLTRVHLFLMLTATTIINHGGNHERHTRKDADGIRQEHHGI